MKNFLQQGDVIAYTNGGGTTIPSGSIVAVGVLLAVAVADIEPGESGAVRISGVVALPKNPATVVAAGDALDYDVSAKRLDKLGSPAAGDLVGCGVAISAAGSSADTVEVLLNVAGAAVQA